MKLVSLPRQLSMSHYDETRAAFLEKHKKIPGIVGILEFGTIPYPGISDMDFFIIVEPDMSITLPHFRDYTEEQRYILGSRQCIMTPDIFQKIEYYDPWIVHMTPIYDPQSRCHFHKKQFSPKGYEALSLNFIHQKLTYGCLPFLGEILSKNAIPVRHFFEEFKLFTYFLREFKKIGIPTAHDPGLTAYKDIGATWFSLSSQRQEEMMINVLRSYTTSITLAYAMLLSAVEGRHDVRTSQGYEPRTYFQRKLLSTYPQSLVINMGQRIFVYQKGVRTLRILRQKSDVPLSSGEPYERMIYVLPWELGCFATPHLFLHGCLSDHYQRFVCTDLPEIPLWSDTDFLLYHELQNRNVYATRNVKNAKYYEMTFGYRAPGSGRGSWKIMLGDAMNGIVRNLSESRLQPLLFSTSSAELWSAPL